MKFNQHLYMTLLLAISGLAASGDAGGASCQPCRCYSVEGVMEADCSHRNLHEIPIHLPPNITDLNLSGNNIVRLENGYLNYNMLLRLDVSSNRVRSIELDAFRNLTNLVTLDLRGNQLPPTNKSYHDGVFRYQGRLRKLYIHNNVELRPSAVSLMRSFSSSYPDGAFKDLFALEELIIDGMREIYFGTGFKFLKQLKYLSLGGGEGGICYTRNLRNNTFENVQNLKTLDVSHCLLIDIELSTFEMLKNLQILDLSFNRFLGISKAGQALYGLQNSSLKVFDASALSRTLGPSITLQTTDMKYLKNIELEELNITGNRIELIDRNAMLYLPRSLKKICIRDNHLGFGLYMLELFILTNLKWFDASYQGTSSLSFFDNEKLYSRHRRHSVQNTQALTWKVALTIPPNATYADFSYCKMTYDIVNFHFSENSLRELNLSHNYLSKWIGPIWGLKHLEIVDLSHNFCDFIGKEFGKHFPSIKTLNLGYNYLGYTLQNSNFFHDFPLLENLDLSNNKITSFPKTIIKNLTLIKNVNLSNNYLMTWNSKIVNFDMKMLDLSRNLFEEVPSLLRHQVGSMTMNDFKLYFEENPLRCSCTTLASLIWMTEHASKIQNYAGISCVDDGGRKVIMENIHQVILDLKKKCASYLGMTLGALCLVMLVLCLGIAGIVYRFRWKLRYLYYLARMKHRGYVASGEEEEDGSQFEFDAFISYADEDRGIVVEDMRQILEGRHGLRLCIHHRDFLVGEAIAANILNAIKSSRKTVIVLSRNFLRSYWCKYEVEMAKMESIYAGRNTLLVVVLENIPVKDLPPDIVELMRQDSYVEYTNDREGQEVFWQNIDRAVRIA